MSLIQKLLGGSKFSNNDPTTTINMKAFSQLEKTLVAGSNFNTLAERVVMLGVPTNTTGILSVFDTIIVPQNINLIEFNGLDLAIVCGVDNNILLRYTSRHSWELVGTVDLDHNQWHIRDGTTVLLKGYYSASYQRFEQQLLDVLNTIYKHERGI